MGCYNSTIVDAPVDKVWATLRDFHDFSWCSDVVPQLEVVGDAGNTEVGAKRLLNGVFHETLVELDDEARLLRYSIDDGPEAVSKDKVKGYIGEVRAFGVTDDDSTFVLWTSSWESTRVEFRNSVIRFTELSWPHSRVILPPKLAVVGL